MKKNLIKMLGTRNQQNLRNKIRIEEESVFKLNKKTGRNF